MKVAKFNLLVLELPRHAFSPIGQPWIPPMNQQNMCQRNTHLLETTISNSVSPNAEPTFYRLAVVELFH